LRDLPPEAGNTRTPRVKFTVDDLVEHLLGSVQSLGSAARTTLPTSAGAS
jgi:hypothetical protein